MSRPLLRSLLFSLALTAVAAHAEGGKETPTANPLALDAPAIKQAGIVLAKLGTRPLTDEIKAPGEVKADAYSTVLVAPRIESMVLKRLVKLGDVVKAGQPLVVLSSVQVAETQGALIVAERGESAARPGAGQAARVWPFGRPDQERAAQRLGPRRRQL